MENNKQFSPQDIRRLEIAVIGIGALTVITLLIWGGPWQLQIDFNESWEDGISDLSFEIIFFLIVTFFYLVPFAFPFWFGKAITDDGDTNSYRTSRAIGLVISFLSTFGIILAVFMLLQPRFYSGSSTAGLGFLFFPIFPIVAVGISYSILVLVHKFKK